MDKANFHESKVSAQRTTESSSKQKSLPAYSPARSSYFFPVHRNDETASYTSPRPPPPIPNLALPEAACFLPSQTEPHTEDHVPEQNTMSNTYEMQDLSPLNHLAVNAWVRDKRDSSCRAWTVKVILGLCIGVLAAAVVALSIMLSTHCNASPGQSAAYTSTFSTTLTETKDLTATATGTATTTRTIMQTTTASAGGARTTVTETKVRYSSSVSTQTVTATTALTSYICTSSSSTLSTSRTSTSSHRSSRTSSSAPSTSSGGTKLGKITPKSPLVPES